MATIRRALLAIACLIVFACNLPCARAQGFAGLATGSDRSHVFWEGDTNYEIALKPAGTIRAVMLFARFPDTTQDETPESLYAHLVPNAIAFFHRVSYGRMALQVTPVYRWIPMDHPSTWPGYSAGGFESQKTYLAEVIDKAKDVDFGPADIVYVVGSRSPGTPNSPTWTARPGEGIRTSGKEIRHAVTFGNDTRGENWGWQTLCHETGHVFGLPDLYSFNFAPPYKNIQKYVGFWDLMGFQGVGAEYLAWQKRKLGWLDDSDFVVVRDGAASERLISPIYEPGGKKAVVVPISPTEVYVAEVRSREGLSDPETGVLLYRVSLNPLREGHIRVLPAAPDDGDTKRERRFITLYNALFREGVVLDDPANHIRIEITGHSGQAYFLRVTH